MARPPEGERAQLPCASLSERVYGRDSRVATLIHTYTSVTSDTHYTYTYTQTTHTVSHTETPHTRARAHTHTSYLS